MEETFQGFRTAAAQRENKTNVSKMLSSLKQYSLSAANFNSAARNVVDIFSLSELEDPVFWSLLLPTQEDNPAKMQALYQINLRINFAIKFLPQVVDLLRQNSDFADETTAEEPSGYEGMEVITLLLAEDSKHLSSPQRLIDALESVQVFYEVCSTINGGSAEPLSVLSCDSGSDKSFDLLGTKEVVTCVKDLILSLWNNVVYYKENKNEKMIEGIQKTLPVLEQIATMEQEQTLSPEAAENLRRKLLPGVEKFIGAGVITPEIQVHTVNEPRKLLAASPKLLTRAPIALIESTADSEAASSKRQTKKFPIVEPSVEESFNDDEPSQGNLSSKERAQLKKLMEKMNATNASTDDKQ